MNEHRTGLIAAALIGSGLFVWALGLFADPLGLGGVSGFEWKQVAAAEVGAASVFVGVMLLALRSKDSA